MRLSKQFLRWLEDTLSPDKPAPMVEGYKPNTAKRAGVELRNGHAVLPDNVRRWWYYPIEMPVTKDGHGPATVGVDADRMTYEVWDRECRTFASFDNLPDAINEAIRLNERKE